MLKSRLAVFLVIFGAALVACQVPWLPTTTTTIPGTTTTTAAPTTTTSTSTTTTTSTVPTTTTTIPSSAFGVKVAGANLTDMNGKVIQLRGVNRAGTEYSCVQANAFTTSAVGFTTSPTYADTEAVSLLNWDKAGTSGTSTHAINTVRIPLNEDCWLGINGANAAVSGANYQAFIKRLVTDLTAQHMYVVLDLHWAAPGTILPGKTSNGQNVAPDAEHSVPFWSQVATTFGGYSNVLFDLFNEPGVWCAAGNGCPTSVQNGGYAVADKWAWTSYRDGVSYTYTSADGQPDRVGMTFQTAGIQQLVDTIRTTGAKNPVIVETLGWGSGALDIAGQYLPNDPLKQVIFSSHHYDFAGNQAGTTAEQTSLNNVLIQGSITGKVPYFVGEWGTNQQCPNTNSSWITTEMSWLDSHKYSYTAWAIDSGQGCGGPALNTNNETLATTPYGAVVKAGLQADQGS